MATTHGQSTYAQIIDDVRFDINDGAKLSTLPDRAIQKWILDAQEKICQLIQVDESYNLGLNTDVKDYPFQERPLITGATNASPIVITSASHGLTNDDRIFVTGVLGNTAANGAMQIYDKTTDTFKIRQVVDVTNASNETPIEITAEDHGFSTGDSITISEVEGNTAANATWTITVTGDNTFTCDTSVGTATYTGGGIATKATTGNAAYTAGGRYWRDDELPIHLNRITAVRRPWGEYVTQPAPENMDYVVSQEVRDSDFAVSYDSSSAPVKVSEYSKLDTRYLRFYPAPKEDKTVTIFGSMLLPARNYTGDALSANVMLPFKYEEALRYYVKANIYQWLKDGKMWLKMDDLFFRAIQEFKDSQPSYVRLDVRYS